MDRQPQNSTPNLQSQISSPADRRILLASTMNLYLRRIREGLPVTTADLLRLASYGDDPLECGALFGSDAARLEAPMPEVTQ